jgi:hypothetical protein
VGAKDVSVLNLALKGEEIIVPNCSLYCKYKLSRFVNIQFFFAKKRMDKFLNVVSRGARKLTRENQKVVCAEFSTLR